MQKSKESTENERCIKIKNRKVIPYTIGNIQNFHHQDAIVLDDQFLNCLIYVVPMSKA